MANTTENDDKKNKKPLTLSKPGKLELKKTVEGGQVRQSFSHGRSKTVAVEVKKKRTFQAGQSGRMTEVKDTSSAEVQEQQAPAPVDTPAEPARARTLTDAEQATRARALEEARKAAEDAARESAAAQAALEEARKKGEEEALAKAREAEQKAAEAEVAKEKVEEAKAQAEAASVPKPERKTRRQIEEEARRAAEAEAQSMAVEAAPRAATAAR
ncbi:MAG: translation initiation factor IF-2 associated domain-containing protein [Alphaproteobacteria bacterium]